MIISNLNTLITIIIPKLSTNLIAFYLFVYIGQFFFSSKIPLGQYLRVFSLSKIIIFVKRSIILNRQFEYIFPIQN